MEQPTITITPIQPTLLFTIRIDDLINAAIELQAMFAKINDDIKADDPDLYIPFEYVDSYADQIYNHYSESGVEIDSATCEVLAHLMNSIDNGYTKDM